MLKFVNKFGYINKPVVCLHRQYDTTFFLFMHSTNGHRGSLGLPTICIGSHLTATTFLEILKLPIAFSLLELKALPPRVMRNLSC